MKQMVWLCVFVFTWSGLRFVIFLLAFAQKKQKMDFRYFSSDLGSNNFALSTTKGVMAVLDSIHTHTHKAFCLNNQSLYVWPYRVWKMAMRQGQREDNV